MSTGDERAVIMLTLDHKTGGILGQHGEKLLYPVSQRIVQNMDKEHVSDLELIQIREELVLCKTGMSGEDAVGGLAADRES